MKNALLVIILSAGLVTTACSQQNKDGQKTSISNITTDSLKASMNRKDIVILDVRTPEEYAGGHVEGAININYRDPSFAAEIDKLDKGKKYEVYCRSGGRSSASTKLMQEKGFDASNVTGGMLDWEAKGYPVSR